MKIKAAFIYFCLLLTLVCKVSAAVDRNVLDPIAEINRIKLEEVLEERLKNRLKSILQDEYVFVIVKVRLAGEELEPFNNEESGDEYALPGVPVEKNITAKQEKNEDSTIRRYTSRIANVYAWIFVSKDIPKESLEKARVLSSEILSIDLTRGDTLTIEAYLKEVSLWKELKSSEVIVKLIAMAIVLIALIIFLFGPLGIYLKKSTPLNQPIGGITMVSSPQETQPGGEGSSYQSSPEISRETIVKKEESGLSFLEQKNASDIAYIVERSTAEEAITVLNNVKPVVAGRIFNRLSPTKQKEIIASQDQVGFLNPDTVKRVETKLKEKVNLIYGGPLKISQFLQNCSTDVKDGIISWMKESNPELATQVMNNILEFNDLAGYDDLSFRKIFRSVGLNTFAVSLKGLDDDMIEQFKSKLNPDVVTLIDEQMKIISPSAAKISESKAEVLDNVLRLIRSGDIESLEGKELI